MVFLCDLCALCGENAFDPRLESRRQRRSYGKAQDKKGRIQHLDAASFLSDPTNPARVFARS